MIVGPDDHRLQATDRTVVVASNVEEREETVKEKYDENIEEANARQKAETTKGYGSITAWPSPGKAEPTLGTDLTAEAVDAVATSKAVIRRYFDVADS